MRNFDYRKVYSLQEAVDAASRGKATAFLAGGTDLLLLIKNGKRLPQQIVDLKGITEIDGITISGSSCSIGALSTIRTLETAPFVAQKLPLLAQAASD